jgi:recombination protein RecR
MALENVGGFSGTYHVLGGVLNPLNHVGPEDLKIDELLQRINDQNIEIILATNPTMEGEATALYVRKKIREINNNVQITRIGSGLPMGADMEFADQATLSRAMEGRTTI